MDIIIESVITCALVLLGFVGIFFYFAKEKNEKLEMKSILPLGKNKILYLCITFVLMTALIVFFNTLSKTDGLLHNLNLLVLVACIFPMAAVDFKTNKIPNLFLLAALVFRVCLLVAEFVKSRSAALLILKDNVLGALIIGAFFLLIFFIFKNSIGMGDIKLFTLLGLYLGFTGVINAVFFSLLVSLVLSIGLLISGKKKRKDAISFAPSILLGTIISIVLTGIQ